MKKVDKEAKEEENKSRAKNTKNNNNDIKRTNKKKNSNTIFFLELTSGGHDTVSKYGCSWNDRRQPIFAVTPLFSRVYFTARFGRHFKYSVKL